MTFESDDEMDDSMGAASARDKFSRERMNMGGGMGMDHRPPYGGRQQGNGYNMGGGGRSSGGRYPGGGDRRRPFPGGEYFDSNSPVAGGGNRRRPPGGSPVQPPQQSGGMLTFKQFLASQDDSITDEDAVSKYGEYKLEYRRQQLHAFFVAHKEEEWFRLRYHPVDSARCKQEHHAAISKRLESYQRLIEKGWIERALPLEESNLRNVVTVLDGLVVILEGGDDNDLEILEQMAQAEAGEKRVVAADSKIKSEDAAKSPEKKRKKKDPGSPSSEAGELSDSDAEEGGLGASPQDEDEGEAKEEGEEETVVAADPAAVARVTNLHRTASIFLRNIAPSITKAEIEALFTPKYSEYLRTAIADPLPERRFYRRGWVSFKREANVKEICWNLNNVRIRDCELGAIINRDLTRKTRSVPAYTQHRSVAQAFVKLAARLVQVYDLKNHVYQPDQTTEEKKTDADATTAFGLDSLNPLLSNISDFLIEEGSAEEDELLGQTGDVAKQEGAEAKITIDRDEALLKVLDRIIIYLRLVHSVDFYNHGEYLHEDEMPNRCGLVHVRGNISSIDGGEATPDPEGQGNLALPAFVINDYIKSFEDKIQPLLKMDNKLTNEEAEKHGKKDAEKEVEAFLNANCQELAKDKWLCPLSGKKFKGPEFVRKHILNKHVEKVDEVKAEVDFFNNYLYDPSRPMVPEMLSVAQPQPPRQQPPPGSMGAGGSGGGDYYGGGGGGGPGRQQRSYSGQRRGYGNARREPYSGGARQAPAYGGGGGGGGGRRDPRELRTYHDLDAPSDDPF